MEVMLWFHEHFQHFSSLMQEKESDNEDDGENEDETEFHVLQPNLKEEPPASVDELSVLKEEEHASQEDLLCPAHAGTLNYGRNRMQIVRANVQIKIFLSWECIGNCQLQQPVVYLRNDHYLFLVHEEMELNNIVNTE